MSILIFSQSIQGHPDLYVIHVYFSSNENYGRVAPKDNRVIRNTNMQGLV